MRILITGSTGFIGTNLMNDLSKNIKYKFLIISKQKKKIYKNCYYINSDIKNINKYKNKIIKFNPDTVIHLAWEGIPILNKENSLKNLSMSLNFFNLVFKYTNCKKIIVTGSCFEYGKKFGKCKETDIEKIDSYFAWSKLSLFKFLKFSCNKNNISLFWLRLFYVYGDLQREESIIPLLIDSIQNKNKLPIKFPYNRTDFIYIKDVMIAISKCLKSNNLFCGAINIGYGSNISILNLYNIIYKIILKKTNKNYFKKEKKVLLNFSADIKLANKILKWKPIYKIEHAINELVK